MAKNKIIESHFQLDYQRLIELNFKIKEKIELNNEKPILNIKTKIGKDENKKIARVTLSVYVEKDFTMDVSIEGYFKWSNTSENDLEKLLITNAPAVLFSYIRSIVSNTVVYAGLPPIILPLINFNESNLEKIEEKKTKKEPKKKK